MEQATLSLAQKRPSVPTPKRTREGWPPWAMSRIECAACGKTALHFASPPHTIEPGFEDWVRLVWPDGRVQLTRYGFRIWCSGGCEASWKRNTNVRQHAIDGHGHQLLIRQEELAWKKGLVG
jgi:hypothetical protein